MFLYHATDSRNIPSILKKGLLTHPPKHNWDRMTDNAEVIYLAFNAETAMSYAENQDEMPAAITVLKINVDALEPYEFGYDWQNRCEYMRDINSCVYEKDIPPEAISLCSTKDIILSMQELEDFKGTPLYNIITDTFDEECETNKERW